jgi:hypothetical protein
MLKKPSSATRPTPDLVSQALNLMIDRHFAASRDAMVAEENRRTGLRTTNAGRMK